jgi:RNA polymerase sigma-70 factor (ECF subfamily)
MSPEERSRRRKSGLIRPKWRCETRRLWMHSTIAYHRPRLQLCSSDYPYREDAEDVVVDVFWQPGSMPADTMRLAEAGLLAADQCADTAIDALRSSNRHAVQSFQTTKTDSSEDRRPAAVAENPGNPGILAETRQAVRAALKTLPEQQRIPLEMAYFEGMTHTEIAESLNQPLGTMKDRIRTGMSHLRRQLKAYL